MSSAGEEQLSRSPVITARLGRRLGVVLLLFALLVVNSVYLAAITWLEYRSGEVYQDYFYLLMFLLHLVLGLLLILPLLLFALPHMRRAWHRPNRDAVRAGVALFISALLLLVSGLLLTRFDFFEVNDPLLRRIGYWLHVGSPFAVVWLFVLHRLAGPPIRWHAAVRWSVAATVFAAVMLLWNLGLQEGDAAGPVTAFPPSLAVLSGSETIPAEHLMTDAVCAECHEDIARRHEYSMHRFSTFNNPAYTFSVREAREVLLQRDGTVQATRFCAACHDPVPLFSGRFDDPGFDAEGEASARAGITCVSCHAITQINGVRGNGNYTLVDPPRYPFAFSNSALLQAVNRQLIKAKPAYHKHTLLKPLHRSAEFCATCHKVHLPVEVNNYRWLRGQDHYDSFLFSGVSGHRVDSFYYPEQAVTRCSECHMALRESADPAARDFDDSDRRSVHDHRFAAANTGVAHLLDLPGEVIAAQREQLTDVTRVDIFALKEDGRIDGQLHAPLRPDLPVLQPGRRYLVEVVVRTTGLGHHLTQGTADSNQLWLDVTATADSRVIGRSGAMDASGQVDPWSYFVNAYVLDREGHRIDRRNAQDIFVALYNHQIPPGAASVVHYALTIPADVQGPVELSTTLQYRKFDTTYLRHIQGDAFSGNDLPVTAMATDRVVLPVATPDTVAAQGVTTKPYERWNDYGIGLLREGNGGAGRGELRQAEQAFRQVEAQGYGMGALNLARVYFREGRLDEAAAALQRAGNGNRAAPPWSIAWYSALIDRENGHLDVAIDTLESLVETRFQDARARGFDFSQDIRILNELGRAEFERSRQLRGKAHTAQRQAALLRARDWFLQVLVIEPEDLTAHHNLALVYSALGEKQLAAGQRELHEKYRPDDQAIEQAVTRHRSSNPAADHAAAAIVIHNLDRKVSGDVAMPADMPGDRQPDRITRLSGTVHSR